MKAPLLALFIAFGSGLAVQAGPASKKLGSLSTQNPVFQLNSALRATNVVAAPTLEGLPTGKPGLPAPEAAPLLDAIRAHPAFENGQPAEHPESRPTAGPAAVLERLLTPWQGEPVTSERIAAMDAGTFQDFAAWLMDGGPGARSAAAVPADGEHFSHGKLSKASLPLPKDDPNAPASLTPGAPDDAQDMRFVGPWGVLTGLTLLFGMILSVTRLIRSEDLLSTWMGIAGMAGIYALASYLAARIVRLRKLLAKRYPRPALGRGQMNILGPLKAFVLFGASLNLFLFFTQHNNQRTIVVGTQQSLLERDLEVLNSALNPREDSPLTAFKARQFPDFLKAVSALDDAEAGFSDPELPPLPSLPDDIAGYLRILTDSGAQVDADLLQKEFLRHIRPAAIPGQLPGKPDFEYWVQAARFHRRVLNGEESSRTVEQLQERFLREVYAPSLGINTEVLDRKLDAHRRLFKAFHEHDRNWMRSDWDAGFRLGLLVLALALSVPLGPKPKAKLSENP